MNSISIKSKYNAILLHKLTCTWNQLPNSPTHPSSNSQTLIQAEGSGDAGARWGSARFLHRRRIRSKRVNTHIGPRKVTHFQYGFLIESFLISVQGRAKQRTVNTCGKELCFRVWDPIFRVCDIAWTRKIEGA